LERIDGEQRLAAVVAGELAGYAPLVAADEALAAQLVGTHGEIVKLLVSQHLGRLVDFRAGRLLAEFSNSLAAVRCAVEIQNVVRGRVRSLPESSRIEFQIGIHQGRVRVEGEELAGAGVDAARHLAELAPPGCICFSGPVFERLTDLLDFECEDLGERAMGLRNAIHIYRFGAETKPVDLLRPSQATRSWRVPAQAATIAALLSVAAIGWQQGWFSAELFSRFSRESSPQPPKEASISNPRVALPRPSEERTAKPATPEPIQVFSTPRTVDPASGMAELQGGSLASALRALEQAVQENPEALDQNVTMLGVARYRAGQHAEAVQLWERVRAANPQAAADRVALAQHYEKLGRHEEAAVAIAEVLAFHPTYTTGQAARWLRTGGLAESIVTSMLASLEEAGLPSGPPNDPARPRPAATARLR